MGQRDYTTLRVAGAAAYGVLDLPEVELSTLLTDPERLLWQNINRPVKIDHGSLMVEAELPLAGGSVHVAYKQYRPRNGWKAFCWLFRRSRARRAWQLGRELIARQIATARPLLMCEVRGGRFRRRSYLATEWIESAENLHLYGWALAGRPDRDRLRRAARCARSLGRLVGRMHARGVAHRDLKAANLLVAERGDSADGEPMGTYLIDLDGVRIRRRVHRGRRAADLARLAAGIEAHPWLTRSVSCRFLHAYAAQFPPGAVAWKSLWRDVARRSRRIVRRKRRRGEEVL